MEFTLSMELSTLKCILAAGVDVVQAFGRKNDCDGVDRRLSSGPYFVVSVAVMNAISCVSRRKFFANHSTLSNNRT